MHGGRLLGFGADVYEGEESLFFTDFQSLSASQRMPFWNPEFTEVFVARLAEACAPQCTRSASAANRAHQVAAELLPEAKRNDARERAASQISRATSWISARRR